MRLDGNLCQVLIDVEYTKDWQLGLKKNLQDSKPVKPVIFTTQKMKLFVKDLFNKCEQIRSFISKFTFTKKILTEKFLFFALICTMK